MLAESGVGSVNISRVGDIITKYTILTSPESKETFDVGEDIGEDFCKYHRALNRKFFYKLYIDLGHKPFYAKNINRKRVVFNYHLVKDLLFRYAGFAVSLLVHTTTTPKNTRQKYYLYMFFDYFMFKSKDDSNYVLSITDASTSLSKDEATTLKSFLNKFHFCEIRKAVFERFRKNVLGAVRKLELSMSVKQFIKFKQNLIETSSHALLTPVVLSIYLQPDTKEEGSDGDDSENDDGAFEVEWIIDVFPITQVEELTLEYFFPRSRIRRLSYLLTLMPKLSVLNISFGMLDFAYIPRMIRPKPFDFYIQVRIDRGYYETVKYRFFRTKWVKEILDDCVILNCVKKKG
ncbi:hypothetical protein I9W82_003480 [Candida metapsilosis]|uniref:Uncharacterized protein n=1 Tax=Candida metapsilosis TaxID=273372 RepID=A0A8H8DB13_9ASCO|nr:hypothetical protein I9W82_003480 [Candida metapsilosis]